MMEKAGNTNEEMKEVTFETFESDFIATVPLSTRRNRLKWIMILLTLIATALISVFFPPFAFLALVGCFGLISMAMLSTSHDRVNTSGKAISLIHSAATGLMVFAAANISPVTTFFVIASFAANKILFDGDVPNLLRDFADWGNRLKEIKRETGFTEVVKHLGYASLCTALSLPAAFIVTAGMFVGTKTLMVPLLGAATVAAPQVMIPLYIAMGIFFVANTSFARKGIKKSFSLLGALIHCAFLEDYEADNTTYSKGLQAVMRFLFGIKKADSPSKIAWKLFKSFLIVCGVAAIVYLSQHGLILSLLPKLLQFPPVAFLLTKAPILTAVSFIGIGTRIFIVFPKVSNVASKAWRIAGHTLHRPSDNNNAPIPLTATVSYSTKFWNRVYRATISENRRENYLRQHKLITHQDRLKLERKLSAHCQAGYDQASVWGKTFFITKAIAGILFDVLGIPLILANAGANFYFGTNASEKIDNAVASFGINANAFLDTQAKQPHATTYHQLADQLAHQGSDRSEESTAQTKGLPKSIKSSKKSTTQTNSSDDKSTENESTRYSPS